MSTADESKAKKVDFLKVIASNPDKKITEIAKEFQMSQTSAYNAINEFVHSYIWSDEDPDFPNRLLTFYNKDIENKDEQLNETDVEQLQHFVDSYYEKHLPGGNLSKRGAHPPSPVEEQTYNAPVIEETYSTMSGNNYPPPAGYPQAPPPYDQSMRKDMSTDIGLLATLLRNAKYVHPTLIDRFLNQYELGKEHFDRNPKALLAMMKHVFTAQQGEEIFNLYQGIRGKYVVDSNGQVRQQGAMDPAQMMMFMNMMNGGGGNMNPLMMMMNNPNMDPNMMMQMMMMSQMSQKSEKDKAREQQNEMFEKLIQAIMLKMVGGSMEDKKPWDMYGMGGMGMGGPMMGPPVVNELYDESGTKVKSRSFTPNIMGMQQQNHQDPLLTMMLGKTMDANTQLLMKMTETGKTPTDILMSMIPYFKDSGNASLQLSQMMETVNKIAPGFFDRSRDPQSAQNIEIAKLKFDTELAMQAQKMELSRMEHQWRIDEMDRKANNDNASNWMSMLENLGSSFTEKVAPALIEGFGKGGMLSKPGAAQAPQPSPQEQLMRQQMMMQRQRQMQEEERREEEQERAAQAQQQMQQPPPQGQDPSQLYFMIAQLQSALQRSEAQNRDLAAQIQSINSMPTQAYQHAQMSQGQQPIDEQRLLRMSTGELQQLLQEIKMANNMEQSLGNKVEAIISNRLLMDQHHSANNIPPPPPPPTTEDQAFDTGIDMPEEASSEDTRKFEEHGGEQE